MSIKMQALYLLDIGEEVHSQDLQSLELTLTSPMDSFLKNAPKTTLRLPKLIIGD